MYILQKIVFTLTLLLSQFLFAQNENPEEICLKPELFDQISSTFLETMRIKRDYITNKPIIKNNCFSFKSSTTSDPSVNCERSLTLKCFGNDSTQLTYRTFFHRKTKDLYTEAKKSMGLDWWAYFFYVYELSEIYFSGNSEENTWDCCEFVMVFYAEECIPIPRFWKCLKKNTSKRTSFTNNGQLPLASIVSSTYSSPYPNPASDRVQWDVFSNKPIKIEMAIVDVLGKTIKQQTTFFNEGYGSISISTEGLASANYLYVLSDGHNIKRGKIQVNH